MGPQRIKGNMKTKVTTDEMKKLEEMRQNFENAKQIVNCVLRDIYVEFCAIGFRFIALRMRIVFGCYCNMSFEKLVEKCTFCDKLVFDNSQKSKT